MLKIYKFDKATAWERLIDLLPENSRILKTQSGKPYIKGNPLFFSLAHTGDTALVALCDKQVGIDCEVITQKKFSAILKRFTPREQAEIAESNFKFFENWVVKEAFIKMLGATLATHLKRLEYYDRKLFLDGKRTGCEILLGTINIDENFSSLQAERVEKFINRSLPPVEALNGVFIFAACTCN